jgi:hypothetical protein
VVVEVPLHPMSVIAKGSIWRQIYDSVWLRFE